jgi:hypothetical protein
MGSPGGGRYFKQSTVLKLNNIFIFILGYSLRSSLKSSQILDKSAKLFKETSLIVLIAVPFVVVFISFFSLNEYSESNVASASVEATGGRVNVVHILRDSTATYNIVDNQTQFIGPFDTTYFILGIRDSLNGSKDFILSTIRDDFKNSPTIGYIRAGNATADLSVTNQSQGRIGLPNPFVDLSEINQTIDQQVGDAIGSAQALNSAAVTIRCDFDGDIKDWKCVVHG